MQVDMQDIKSQIAGTGDAQQGVQVGAVAVNQPAGLMYGFDDFQHMLVEQAQRVGIGEH